MRKTINKPAKRKSASQDEQLPPTWSRDCSSYSSTEAKLTPTRTTGPQNLPDSLQQDSGPCEILNLFWTDDLWHMQVQNANRQSEFVQEKNPKRYVAKNFESTTIEEMKAFLWCRIALEVLFRKDH